ncbi:MAG: hypothetical protein ACREEC_05345 [Thermoplasmata archaeon]
MAMSKQGRGDARVKTPDRHQWVIRPECDDQLIDQDHEARVIWQVLQRLDLSAFYAPLKARAGV